MKPEDFDLFAILVKQRSGLVLTPDKAYLLESRLLPLIRKHNLKTLEDMAQMLRAKRDETLMAEIAEAMTTNDSFFFRDRKPFTYFQQSLLPRLLAARASKKHIRIWSAAASSGQEAYSLAMICAEEAARLEGWKVDIIGTDLSREMVARAKAGIYSHFEVQRGLPIAYLVKYFVQIAGDKWQIKDHIRRMAQFHEGNLLADCKLGGTFDMVLCRNVLTCLDAPSSEKVLATISNIMAADGYLLLGSGETVLGVADKFNPLADAPGFYAPLTPSISTAGAATG